EVDAHGKAVELHQEVLAPAVQRHQALSRKALDRLAAVAMHGPHLASGKARGGFPEDDDGRAFGHGWQYRGQRRGGRQPWPAYSLAAAAHAKIAAMNSLAHAYLAAPAPEAMLGALLGDFVFGLAALADYGRVERREILVP